MVQASKRVMAEDNRFRPGAVVPDLKMDSYMLHVASRTEVFFKQVLAVALMVKKKGGVVSPKLFSDHAEVQVQSGQRHEGVEAVRGEKKWDAAHLMNTSLVPKEYAKQSKQDVDSEDVQERWVASGATVNQFQKSNVSADKVIDSHQTLIKDEMLHALQTPGVEIDEKFILFFVNRYLSRLLAHLKSKALGAVISGLDIKGDSYIAACKVIHSQHENPGPIVSNILDELGGVAKLFQ